MASLDTTVNFVVKKFDKENNNNNNNNIFRATFEVPPELAPQLAQQPILCQGSCFDLDLDEDGNVYTDFTSSDAENTAFEIAKRLMIRLGDPNASKLLSNMVFGAK